MEASKCNSWKNNFLVVLNKIWHSLQLVKAVKFWDFWVFSLLIPLFDQFLHEKSEFGVWNNVRLRETWATGPWMCIFEVFHGFFTFKNNLKCNSKVFFSHWCWISLYYVTYCVIHEASTVMRQYLASGPRIEHKKILKNDNFLFYFNSNELFDLLMKQKLHS